jgi:ankyrin repeat protein
MLIKDIMISKRLMIALLLSVIAHVHAADQKEWNRQLYNALMYGAPLERVKNLIEVHHADIKGVEEHSLFRTPALNLAAGARTQDSSALSYLIEYGVDVNAKDCDDFTPCHYAAAGNRADLIEILSNNKANVNAKNKYGCTPLHSACLQGAFHAAKVLLKHGANVQEKNKEGQTPLDIARKNHYEVIVKYLEEWESVPEIKQPEED